jgi:hypothetical protein
MYMTRELLVLLLGCVGATQLAHAVDEPALPAIRIEPQYVHPKGQTIYVPAGANLQAALDEVRAGQTVVLQAGATYEGNFTISNKSGTEGINIISSGIDMLPAFGSRVDPTRQPSLARIVTKNGLPAMTVMATARKIHFAGLELTSKPASPRVYNLFVIENADHVTIDRCYLHGDSASQIRRAILVNGNWFVAIGNHISDIHEAGMDSQAIGVCNSAGPILIDNNHLEASTENVMFGGCRAAPGVTPSDVHIRNNTFFKPLTWKGGPWAIKNLLEFKHVQRALVEGNVFQNSWWHAQNGFAVVITVRTSDSGEHAVTNDITIRDNKFLNVEGGFNITGKDDIALKAGRPGGEAKRISILHNWFSFANTQNRVTGFALSTGIEHLNIAHNTQEGNCTYSMFANSGNVITTSIAIEDNVLCRQPTGDYSSSGTEGLRRYYGNAVEYIRNNLMLIPFTDVTHLFNYGNRVEKRTGPAVAPLEPYRYQTFCGQAIGARPFAGVSSSFATIALRPTVSLVRPGESIALFADGGLAGVSITPPIGTISPTGVYTAPTKVDAVTPITACALAGGATRCASIVLRRSPNLSVNPREHSLNAGQQVAFRADLIEVAATPIRWSVEPAIGSISADGVYTAPKYVGSPTQIRVVALAVSDPLVSGSVALHLKPVEVVVNPVTASLSNNKVLTFRSHVIGTSDPSVTWSVSPAIGTISAAGVYQAPATINQNQTVMVKATSVADETKVAAATVSLKASGFPIDLSSDGFGQLWVAWSSPSGRPTNDWVALFHASGGSWIWKHNTGGASGKVAVPINLPTGKYTAKYFMAGAWILANESPVFELRPPLGVSPYSIRGTVLSGNSVTIEWTAPPGRPADDWVALTGPQGVIYWTRCNGTRSGSFVTKGGLKPGDYAVKYYAEGWTVATEQKIRIQTQ